MTIRGIGDRFVRGITPVSADKLYAIVRDTPSRKGKTSRPRTAAKVVAIARHAWKVVHRLHPDMFDRDVPNPWVGVALKRRQMATKPAAMREEVYAFAWGAVKAGHTDAAGLLRSSALNGSSARKTCWRAMSDGGITAARRHRLRSGSNIGRPAPWSYTRLRRL
jgi:hypothetical protein